MKKLIPLSILFILAFSSCRTSSRIVSSTQLSKLNIEPLTKDQYTILPDVEGIGSASSFLFFGLDYKKRAKNSAMFNAIGKIPGADMLIAPRFEINTFSFLSIYQKATITVKSKAIQLKTQ